jgi:hypothetical protein
MGGFHLATLSLIHPRLLSNLILIDPVIIKYEDASNVAAARASTFRVDLWNSREDAEKSFRRSKFFQSWDERVFQKWIEFGLRNVPTFIYPERTGKGVTLSTTKHQEVFSFFRPNFPGKDENGEDLMTRESHPDLDLTTGALYPFYRPEP